MYVPLLIPVAYQHRIFIFIRGREYLCILCHRPWITSVIGNGQQLVTSQIYHKAITSAGWQTPLTAVYILSPVVAISWPHLLALFATLLPEPDAAKVDSFVSSVRSGCGYLQSS